MQSISSEHAHHRKVSSTLCSAFDSIQNSKQYCAETSIAYKAYTGRNHLGHSETFGRRRRNEATSRSERHFTTATRHSHGGSPETVRLLFCFFAVASAARSADYVQKPGELGRRTEAQPPIREPLGGRGEPLRALAVPRLVDLNGQRRRVAVLAQSGDHRRLRRGTRRRTKRVRNVWRSTSARAKRMDKRSCDEKTRSARQRRVVQESHRRDASFYS